MRCSIVGTTKALCTPWRSTSSSHWSGLNRVCTTTVEPLASATMRPSIPPMCTRGTQSIVTAATGSARGE